MKNKKIILILFIIIILLVISAFFAVPYFKNLKADSLLKEVKNLNSAFTNKILEEFSKNPSCNASEAAKKTAEELNKINKNPFNSKEDLYVFNSTCKEHSNIEYDNNMQMVILTTCNKDGDILARVVIKPPSFVSYYKIDD